eukprot:1140865-Pelagomonas_calceolata.AAC.5
MQARVVPMAGPPFPRQKVAFLEVAGGHSGCDAMSLPALACTLIPMGHPTSTRPQCPPAKSDIAA